MRKLDGLKLASFIVGIIIPLVAVVILLQKVTHIEAPETTMETVDIVPSTVETFIVDYDMYGSMVIGESLIRCEVMNNSGNDYKCIVYLVDSNGVQITEKEELLPSYRTAVFNTTWSEGTPGEYSMTLVYEVVADEGTSMIRCPYTILLNGGNTNVVR